MWSFSVSFIRRVEGDTNRLKKANKLRFTIYELRIPPPLSPSGGGQGEENRQSKIANNKTEVLYGKSSNRSGSGNCSSNSCTRHCMGAKQDRFGRSRGNGRKT